MEESGPPPTEFNRKTVFYEAVLPWRSSLHAAWISLCSALVGAAATAFVKGGVFNVGTALLTAAVSGVLGLAIWGVLLVPFKWWAASIAVAKRIETERDEARAALREHHASSPEPLDPRRQQIAWQRLARAAVRRLRRMVESWDPKVGNFDGKRMEVLQFKDVVLGFLKASVLNEEIVTNFHGLQVTDFYDRSDPHRIAKHIGTHATYLENVIRSFGEDWDHSLNPDFSPGEWEGRIE